MWQTAGQDCLDEGVLAPQVMITAGCCRGWPCWGRSAGPVPSVVPARGPPCRGWHLCSISAPTARRLHLLIQKAETRRAPESQPPLRSCAMAAFLGTASRKATTGRSQEPRAGGGTEHAILKEVWSYLSRQTCPQNQPMRAPTWARRPRSPRKAGAVQGPACQAGLSGTGLPPGSPGLTMAPE